MDDAPERRDSDSTPEGPNELTPDQIGDWLERSIGENAKGLTGDLELARQLKERSLRFLDVTRRDLSSAVNPHELRETGWGVIFPKRAASQRKVHLRRLLRLRENQAGKGSFRTFERLGTESAARFLRRYGETLGTIRPQNVPYYLLIVASPEEIPFEFQYHLSLSRAVGRIWFETQAEYQQYAQAVWDAESQGVELPRQVTIFSVENDKTTKTFGKSLVRPIHLSLKEGFSDWKTTVRSHGEANFERLRQLMGGDETPGLLLVSCHGRRVGPGDLDLQKRIQGGLVCLSSETGEEELFTAESLAPKANPHGLISFFFSCYGAGTPALDNFPHARPGLGPEAALETQPTLLSRESFLAPLPLALLRRGALAVVGHIDRGWTTSVVWTFGERDVDTTYSLEDSLGRLLRGHRLGHALRPLNRRYSQLAARLAQMLNQKRIGGRLNLKELGFYWTAVNDARNLIIVGDPAVYLRGHREPELTIQLDRPLLQRIEKVATHQGVTPETWVYERLKGRV